MQVTEQLIKKWFTEYNDKYWDGKLIMPKIHVSYDKSAWGLARCRFTNRGKTILRVFDYQLYISNYWDTPEETKRGTLIHEMIHHYIHQYHPEEMLWPSYKKAGGHNMDGTWGKEVERFKKLGWDITQFVKEEELALAKESGTSSRITDFERKDKYTLVFHPLKSGRVFMLKMTQEQLGVYIKKDFDSKFYTDEVYAYETVAPKYQKKPFSASHGLGYISMREFEQDYSESSLIRKYDVHLI